MVSELSLPFPEAITFLRQKLNIPTASWMDLWRGAHTRGFSVAGAIQQELIQDLRDSVAKAIEEGTTLEVFRREFDSIVAKHGWAYKGERGWRTDILLNTNIRTAYMAGRFQQMTEPELLRSRPFWQYLHGHSVNPRPEHLAWHGLVLPADDPWWRTHFPPNGWGCNCTVRALGPRDLERLGISVGVAPDEGTYQWLNPKSGKILTIPRGIDPGWDYNVGAAYLRGQQ